MSVPSPELQASVLVTARADQLHDPLVYVRSLIQWLDYSRLPLLIKVSLSEKQPNPPLLPRAQSVALNTASLVQEGQVLRASSFVSWVNPDSGVICAGCRVESADGATVYATCEAMMIIMSIHPTERRIQKATAEDRRVGGRRLAKYVTKDAEKLRWMSELPSRPKDAWPVYPDPPTRVETEEIYRYLTDVDGLRHVSMTSYVVPMLELSSYSHENRLVESFRMEYFQEVKTGQTLEHRVRTLGSGGHRVDTTRDGGKTFSTRCFAKFSERRFNGFRVSSEMLSRCALARSSPELVNRSGGGKVFLRTTLPLWQDCSVEPARAVTLLNVATHCGRHAALSLSPKSIEDLTTCDGNTLFEVKSFTCHVTRTFYAGSKLVAHAWIERLGPYSMDVAVELRDAATKRKVYAGMSVTMMVKPKRAARVMWHPVARDFMGPKMTAVVSPQSFRPLEGVKPTEKLVRGLRADENLMSLCYEAVNSEWRTLEWRIEHLAPEGHGFDPRAPSSRATLRALVQEGRGAKGRKAVCVSFHDVVTDVLLAKGWGLCADEEDVRLDKEEPLLFPGSNPNLGLTREEAEEAAYVLVPPPVAANALKKRGSASPAAGAKL